MDIPAEIPVSYQSVWEDGYKQAIDEGKSVDESVKLAWDYLEKSVLRIVTESSYLWQPIAKYDGKNWELVKQDMNKHRVTMLENNMSVEEVLRMYGITHSKPDYDKIYKWLENGMIRAKKWAKTQNNDTV